MKFANQVKLYASLCKAQGITTIILEEIINLSEQEWGYSCESLWSMQELTVQINKANKLSAKLSRFHLQFYDQMPSSAPEQIQIDHDKHYIYNLCMGNLQKCRFITTINLIKVSLTDQGISLLTKAQYKFVNHLDLSHNHITQEGVKSLIQCQYTYLKSLKIAFNPIKNKGITILCKGKWQLLQILNLSGLQLTNKGMRYLQKLPFKNLKDIYFYSNTIELSSLNLLLKARCIKIFISRSSINQIRCACCSEDVIYRQQIAKMQGLAWDEQLNKDSLLRAFRTKIIY